MIVDEADDIALRIEEIEWNPWLVRIWVEAENLFKCSLGFWHEGSALIIFRCRESPNSSFYSLEMLSIGVLVERLGGQALRLRNERRLAGLMELKSKQSSDNSHESCRREREGSALVAARALTSAQVVVVTASDSGYDA